MSRTDRGLPQNEILITSEAVRKSCGLTIDPRLKPGAAI